MGDLSVSLNDTMFGVVFSDLLLSSLLVPIDSPACEEFMLSLSEFSLMVPGRVRVTVSAKQIRFFLVIICIDRSCVQRRAESGFRMIET